MRDFIGEIVACDDVIREAFLEFPPVTVIFEFISGDLFQFQLIGFEIFEFFIEKPLIFLFS